MGSIERRHGCVFLVHVMKTGGTSLGVALQGFYPPHEFYPPLGGGDGPDPERAAVVAKAFVTPLLEMGASARSRYRGYSVHMPAWVAAEVAPDHLSVTVLREPVARTISHLHHIAGRDRTPDDIEEIYDDPGWHLRLVDYQTRLFAESREDHFQRTQTIRAAIPGRDAPSEAERTDGIAKSMLRFLTTAIAAPLPLDASHLDRALARLDTIDVVGTTEHLDRVAVRVGRHLGTELPPLPRANAGGTRVAVSDTLLERIRADTRLDAALYARAIELAAADD